MIVNVNDMVVADSDKLYRYEKVNPDGTGTGEFVYLKYAPDTLLTTPTAVNRQLLMAMQGFTPCQTVFNPDGSITETGSTGTQVTVFNANGSITQTFTNLDGVSIQKTTVFNSDGSITESIT